MILTDLVFLLKYPMIIKRYILKELIVSLLISIVGLNLILMMEKLLKLSRVLSGVGASVPEMLKVIGLIQPQLLGVTIPMALILSVLITYGRLCFDHELIVLRSSGMRFKDIFRPVMYISAILILASSSISLYLMPESARMLREDINRLIRERAPLTIEPGVFFNTFNGVTLLVHDKEAPDRFRGVFISDSRRRSTENVIVAEEGILSARDSNININLTNGTIHSLSRNGSTEIRFSEYNLNIKIAGDMVGRKRNEMMVDELYREIKKGSTEKINYLIELHRRFSFIAVIISISFLAPPLSLIAGRAGRLGGFITGLLLFASYYVLLTYAENLVRTGRANHMACWAPFTLLTAVSVILYSLKRKRG